MLIRVVLAVLLSFGSVEGGGLGDVLSSIGWAIEKDTGSGAEIVPISDVAAFLAAAELKEHQDALDAEGIILDDIAEMTDELLKDLGITKIMQRKRFIRYAKLMRPHSGEAGAAAKEAAKEATQEANEDTVTEATGAPLQPWVITTDNGQGPEVAFVPDMEAFVEYAELEEHLDLLKGEGITVDNIHSVTSERLEEMGMSKFMHRKRFMRYATNMRRKGDQDLTRAEKKKAWDDNKKKFDAKQAAEREARKNEQQDHKFNMKCTEYGRKLGAC